MDARKKPNLSDVVRNNIALFVYHSTNPPGGRIKHGTINAAAAKFGISRQTVRNVWLKAKDQISFGLPIHLANQKVGIIRPKLVHFDANLLKEATVQKRGSMRKVADALKVSKSTIGRWSKLKLFRTHTSAVKPYLTPEIILRRLKFCVDALYVDIPLNIVKFKSMTHIIHIDEKWFNLSRTSERFYLCLDEDDPYRACKSKRFITKVMFMCAVSRPIYGQEGEVIFDGKIGMWPFTHQVAALRKSRNRPAGTLVTKPVESINREVIKRCLIDKVLPAIKAKWPLTESGNILIQQDNARPHIVDSDPEFREAASSDGFNIHLVQQPPNSPDLNVNDLGWFRALQSLAVENATFDVDELVNAVSDSYLILEHTKLNNVFLSLQSVMIEIMKLRGHNNYRLPHMKKGTLIREGILPVDLQVNPKLVEDCIFYLTEAGMRPQVAGLALDLNLIDY